MYAHPSPVSSTISRASLDAACISGTRHSTSPCALITSQGPPDHDGPHRASPVLSTLQIDPVFTYMRHRVYIKYEYVWNHAIDGLIADGVSLLRSRVLLWSAPGAVMAVPCGRPVRPLR